jgi:mannosyltransferase
MSTVFRNCINKYINYIPYILVLLNFIIKGIFLSNNSIGGDEPFSIYHSQMDIKSIIQILSMGNNPPLFEMILHYWVKLFGFSEFSVRFPSLIFSCITVLFIYKLCQNHLNIQIGIYSSLIFIFSNYHIQFAHEARVYSLLGMLSVLSMYLFLELINEKKRLRNSTFFNSKKTKYWLLILTNTLLIYSHYFGIFILLVQSIVIIFNKRFFIIYKREFFLGILLLIILYFPFIGISISRFLDFSTKGTWIKPPNGLGSIYYMIKYFSNSHIVTITLLITICISAIIFLVNKKKEKILFPFYFIIFWFLFIFILMFGVSYYTPMFIDRYLMPAAVAYCIALGITIDYLSKKIKYKYIVPTIMVFLFIISSKPNISNKRNVRDAVLIVKELQKENTLVIICPHYFIIDFSYYYNFEIFSNYNTTNIHKNIDSLLRKENIYGIDNISQIDYKKWNNIIYLDAAAIFLYPNNNIENTLKKEYEITNSYKIYEIFNIYEFEIKTE